MAAPRGEPRWLQKPKLVTPAQRAYIDSHPLALCFSVAYALVGLVSLLVLAIDPDLLAQNPAAIALPRWLALVLAVAFFAGGVASTGGILRGRRDLEAAGMALLASALLANFASAVAVRSTSAVAGISLIGLAVGCALRSRRLALAGYVDGADHGPAVPWVSANVDGIIIDLSPQACELFGYDRLDLLAQPLTVLMPERYRSHHREGIGRAASRGHSALAGQFLALEGVRSDGTEFPVRLVIEQSGTGEDTVYTGTFEEAS